MPGEEQHVDTPVHLEIVRDEFTAQFHYFRNLKKVRSDEDVIDIVEIDFDVSRVDVAKHNVDRFTRNPFVDFQLRRERERESSVEHIAEVVGGSGEDDAVPFLLCAILDGY